jgi:hypothetical protein
MSLNGSAETCLCLDSTWNAAFSVTPGWLSDYQSHGITDFMSRMNDYVLTKPSSI